MKAGVRTDASDREEAARCLSAVADKRQRGDSIPEERWGIVLAGGEGTRLRPLTRRITGDERPKQFCPIVGKETLLEKTLRRTHLALPPPRTLLVVTRAHERFYRPLLQDIPAHCVAIQPENRGTTPAILYGLLRAAAMTPEGSVAIFPSDHYISDDEAFMHHVEAAFEAVRAMPESVILLGINPKYPETEYGWIEPGDPIPLTVPGALFGVRRFWEKPLPLLAQTLQSGGCFWNSFVMVGQVQGLLSLIEKNIPALYRDFETVRSALNTARESGAVEALYGRLASFNFSQEVLAKSPQRLAVLPVAGIEWSDWGEPSRVLTSLARIGLQPKWAPMPLAASA